MSKVDIENEISPKPVNKKLRDNSAYLFLKSSIKFIVVLGLIGLFYLSWRQQDVIDGLQIRQSQLAIENENLLSQFQVAQQDFENINNSEASSEILFNQQNVRLDNLNEELVSLRLGMNVNRSTGIWQIVEAASMLRLAKQYLDLVQDVPIALSLYQSSNAILAQINDPALDRINSLLMSDIQILRNSQGIDTETFYMRLSVLSQQLSNVSLGSYIEPSSEFLDENSDDTSEGMFNNFSAFLGRYFTVRRLDTPVVIPLNNQQITFVRQNIQLQIEQAKLALLQRRQAIYQDSIGNVIMLAQQNIPEQDQQKPFILGVLRELQGETILLNLTRLSESLSLLENLMGDNSIGASN
ncbi:MAG: uroporphyrinogen-III C-methyltransferase [Gammaproteobacteria bacterium]|nr:uroporphyrinogen-III C-methyltransferase [Gammaproteobacteria bacterium]